MDGRSSYQEGPPSRTKSGTQRIPAGPIQFNRLEVAMRTHSDQYAGLYSSTGGEVSVKPQSLAIDGDVGSGEAK